MGCCLSICKKDDDRLPPSPSSSSSSPAAVIAHRISINEDEGIKSINTTSSPLSRQVTTKATSTSAVTDEEALPPIRFINYNDLKKLPSFPRYPENADLCINEDAIDRSISLVIFISHCWLRGWDGAAGWDGRPHPDNASHDKFQLILAGIEHLKRLAPGMSEVYVWIDY